MTALARCPSCSAIIPAEHRFCGACGQSLSSPSEMPTAMPTNAPALAPATRLVSSDSIPAGGFTPGTILADRYRVIGLLGRGGMGEVYRADDLKLGQPVALKFLPRAVAEDPVRRERFIAEVRIARQVSHPNICRVYDIGEIDTASEQAGGTSRLHFLSMEYIDGEDLASLLKRIGHLHSDKALDLARQLCAGLAAAHDKGVLHRDLKPANVMIDGRRIGLLPAIVSQLLNPMFLYPITFDTSAWYASVGYVYLAVVAAITFYGFRTALGSRPLVAMRGLDE